MTWPYPYRDQREWARHFPEQEESPIRCKTAATATNDENAEDQVQAETVLIHQPHELDTQCRPVQYAQPPALPSLGRRLHYTTPGHMLHPSTTTGCLAPLHGDSGSFYLTVPHEPCSVQNAFHSLKAAECMVGLLDIWMQWRAPRWDRPPTNLNCARRKCNIPR